MQELSSTQSHIHELKVYGETWRSERGWPTECPKIKTGVTPWQTSHCGRRWWKLFAGLQSLLSTLHLLPQDIVCETKMIATLYNQSNACLSYIIKIFVIFQRSSILFAFVCSTNTYICSLNETIEITIATVIAGWVSNIKLAEDICRNSIHPKKYTSKDHGHTLYETISDLWHFPMHAE